MINQDQTIPCPQCQTKIPFDTMQLLMGVQFVCHTCNSAVGLAAESKSIVAETMKKFEEIKSKAA